MNKKIIWGISIIILLAGSIWYFASQKKETKKFETTKVRITTMPVVQGLPFYLALKKGYFKEAGLDVEYVRFESPNQIIDALLQGKVDFTPPSGATGIIGIVDSKNSGKLKIYSLGGGDKTIQNDAILVKKESAITNIAELKGKKLGIVANSIQWRVFAREILAKNGLIADRDVTLVELALGVQPQALATRQVDAILTVEPVPTIVKAKGIGKELVDHAAAKYIASPFYSGAGIMRVGFVQQNPNTTKKVLEVFNRAINEINQNPNQARQYLKEYTSMDEGMIAKVPISRFKMYNNLSKEDTDQVQKMLDLFTKYKIVEKRINFQKLLYTPA